MFKNTRGYKLNVDLETAKEREQRAQSLSTIGSEFSQQWTYVQKCKFKLFNLENKLIKGDSINCLQSFYLSLATVCSKFTAFFPDGKRYKAKLLSDITTRLCPSMPTLFLP